MADKFLRLKKLLRGKGVSLNLSRFLSNNEQFTSPEVKEAEKKGRSGPVLAC